MYLPSKVIFTVLCTLTIIIPSVMDLNKTHMTNPQWTPHVRLHWAVQYLSVTLVQVVALYLLWGDYRDKSSILVTWIAGAAPLLFWGMLLLGLTFPGVSSWPDGVEPPKGFPEIFKHFHPNIILALLICTCAILGIWMDVVHM